MKNYNSLSARELPIWSVRRSRMMELLFRQLVLNHNRCNELKCLSVVCRPKGWKQCEKKKIIQGHLNFEGRLWYYYCQSFPKPRLWISTAFYASQAVWLLQIAWWTFQIVLDVMWCIQYVKLQNHIPILIVPLQYLSIASLHYCILLLFAWLESFCLRGRTSRSICV